MRLCGLLIGISLIGLCASVAEGVIGANWGTMAIHPLPPKIVVQLLQDNGISKVKLFDADEDTMRALAGSNLEVMVAIPNNMLATMNDYDAAKNWVDKNVSKYNFDGGVNVKYVAVGNEPFLAAYNGSFVNTTFPALQNIQNALNDAGLGDTVKATVPLNADVYNSPPTKAVPSAGTFRSDISELMTEMVHFFNKSNAPFTVNIYPFLSLYANKDFPFDYAFFEGTATPIVDNGIKYTNVFDANFDTLVSSLTAAGVPDLPIIIGEVGWPTDGDINANAQNAERFYNGLLPRLARKQGTPLRPNVDIDVYLFGLIDEDAKSIDPGNFERHWGIFRYDGQPKFPMDLSGMVPASKSLVPAKNVNYLPEKWCVLNPDAKDGDPKKLADNVNYACTFSDCTALGYGSSCNGLVADANASYAFNMYFQAQGQKEASCFFQGLGMVTDRNQSTDQCSFLIQIDSSASFRDSLRPFSLVFLFIAAVSVLLFF
ncbi:Glucan endo-1,3-beta-glucosidase 8 [Platanthera zijinensis]|uniref:glucan endo-1,3-beta-D-glucosidase n=1 Tax=Platanthera zijinensis TaxID=2320716 RepID=A0AAP0GF32_9ASPA